MCIGSAISSMAQWWCLFQDLIDHFIEPFLWCRQLNLLLILLLTMMNGFRSQSYFTWSCSSLLWSLLGIILQRNFSLLSHLGLDLERFQCWEFQKRKQLVCYDLYGANTCTHAGKWGPRVTWHSCAIQSCVVCHHNYLMHFQFIASTGNCTPLVIQQLHLCSSLVLFFCSRTPSSSLFLTGIL